jgi:hypothetical protein
MLLCEEKDKPVVIETMNSIILEHGVKTAVKADTAPPAAPITLTYRLDDMVNLYELLPTLNFTIRESSQIISGINTAKITLKELVEYIGIQRRQQHYDDYKGIAITPEHITALKAVMRV